MNAPIFIVGPPRSGTTLTARLLGNHSRIFMPGETHFFDDIYYRKNSLGNFNEKSVKKAVFEKLSNIYIRYNESEDQIRIDNIFKKENIYETFIDKCNNYEDVLTWFMETQMNWEGKKRWGNQVPRDIFNVKTIGKIFPDAKFIVCVRDIKDFLSSYKNKWQTATSLNNRERLKTIYNPIITTLLWKLSVRQFLKIKDVVISGNLYLLKYEDLVSFPEKTTQILCQFVGERYESEMLRLKFSNSSFLYNDKGIYKNSISRWRNELSLEEIFISQFIAKKELRKLEYEVLNVGCDPVKTLALLSKTPAAFYRAMSANQEKRSSILIYLLNRISALIG